MTWWHTLIVAVLASAAALGAWLRRSRPEAPRPAPVVPAPADVSPHATEALAQAAQAHEREAQAVTDALAKPTAAERVEALERLMRGAREREIKTHPRGGGAAGVVLALSLLAGPARAADLPEGCTEADATRSAPILSGMPAPFDGVLSHPCAMALDARCYADREALRVEVAAWTERFNAMQALAYEAQAAREEAEVREREARRARLTWAGGGVLVGIVAAFAVVAVAR